MSSINSDYSSLFNSLYSSSSSSQSTSGTDFLSNWASLKNGSYKKLTKAYYASSNGSAQAVDKEAVKEVVKSNNKIKSNAQSLKDEAGKVKDADSLKKFVEDYNAMIDSGAESDNTGVLRNTLSMTKNALAHENTLAKLGITIGEDNKLTLDEETAKKADSSTYSSLFKGTGSFGDIVATRASEIVNKINSENNKLANYDQSGAYASADSLGKIYDGSY